MLEGKFPIFKKIYNYDINKYGYVIMTGSIGFVNKNIPRRKN